MDLGDIFFIAVFIIIIASNVYKQMKKARLNPSGGETPAKKPGWKGALELILEEARKQMEEQAGQEPAGAPVSRPSGWEGILSKPAPDVNPSEEAAKPEKIIPEKPKPEKAPEPRRQPAVPRETVSDQTAFQTVCVRCGKPMKPVKDQDGGRHSGIVFCEDCGERHRCQMHSSQEALRNAVIWAEILAPPVGLREM